VRKEVLITVGDPVEETAAEITSQVWYTVEAGQRRTVTDKEWDGQWDQEVVIWLPIPWR
jgi:hypothetical protein